MYSVGCCIRRDNDCDYVNRYIVTEHMFIILASRLASIGGSGCCFCSCILYFIGIRVIQKIYSYSQVLVVVSKF